MRSSIKLFAIGFLMLSLPLLSFADGARGLWACKKGSDVYVSWRMRATDSHKGTTYKLYADGNLVSTLTDRTNTVIPSQYANSTFSVEVLNQNGEVIDSQKGVKCDEAHYRHLQLNHPADYNLRGTNVVYSPYDCSAYDMDGDGEQEIIMCWEGATGATAAATAPPILDCLKLDGTLLWRINLGPNVLAGCRFVFLCYDFDGDGYGEVIVKTAQGSKDATGNFLSKGVAQGANHYASSINAQGVITDAGREWLTCFDHNGKELATIDYWPYFNIQSDWDDRPGDKNVDGAGYGHRGNWMKGCVATLPVNGQAKPCVVTTRGIYTYSYAAAYSWDGKSLTNLWQHKSDLAGQGIYGEGAHSITCGDVDGDGYDEVIVGAACLDHNGKVLWRTGLGHGDATHLGEFDPSNDGLEYFMITEEPEAKYDCALLDAKTGKVLMSKAQTGGDTGRGLILDCDSTYDGAECMEWSNAYLFSCKGQEIAEWHTGGTKSSSINSRIYWDGDLMEDYFDRGHADKWNNVTKTWDRIHTFGYKIMVDGEMIEYAANLNNATKYNPCLQADILGDWREEVVCWTVVHGKYFLTIYSTTIESPYKLPWLRDDHVYDMAVAWQNCGYNQPPHLGYSPYEYYRKLRNAAPATIGRWGSGGARNQTVSVGTAMVTTVYNFTNAQSVQVLGTLPPGVTATVANGQLKIGGTPTESGVYEYSLITVGAYDGNEVRSVGGTITVPFVNEAVLTKNGSGSSTQTVEQGSEIEPFAYTWENATGVEVDGLPEGVTYTIDTPGKKVYISGTITAEPGEYKFSVTTLGNDASAYKTGTIIVTGKESTEVIETHITKSGVVLSPNPLDSYAIATVVMKHQGLVRWSLLDLTGTPIRQNSSMSNQWTIMREGLVSGLYMLRADVDDASYIVKLIVR